MGMARSAWRKGRGRIVDAGTCTGTGAGMGAARGEGRCFQRNRARARRRFSEASGKPEALPYFVAAG
ncbi:MAG: hypothetical protein GY859_44085 [Desulfobacterales bacterium]|nr:hypothetical protein [Desulfobacterales bacterium]